MANKNLEVAKRIVRAYWHEVAEDARVGYSDMGYVNTLVTLSRIDEDIEEHIKAIIKIMKAALKELKNGPQKHGENHPKSVGESEEE